MKKIFLFGLALLLAIAMQAQAQERTADEMA